MARLSVAEAVTNLACAAVSDLGDIKCSANWMWAAKLAGEGAAMYDACKAMADFMGPLGVGVDGGKDSLSMAAKVGETTVKAPGMLVVTAYAACPDITATLTPDLKGNAEAGSAGSRLYHLDLSGGRRRLGGTALAQSYSQLGDTPPDMQDPALLRRAFIAVQALLRDRALLSAHDVSDGGLLTAALEMAFAGDIGLNISLPAAPEADGGATEAGVLAACFAEEVGLIVEVAPSREAQLLTLMRAASVPCLSLGETIAGRTVSVRVGGVSHIEARPLSQLRAVWEATSFQLERRQTKPSLASLEETGLATRHLPAWALSFTPTPTPIKSLAAPTKPAVAVIRQEGSNGDREMAAALYAAGLAPWDVTMSDLVGSKASINRFCGLVFVGGFSYADVMDSAKGWAGVLKFNPSLWAQLQAFRARTDTFSLGVCNGCQLMALLGWVPGAEAGAAANESPANMPKNNPTGPAGELPQLPLERQPRFLRNYSGRFESRYASVTILESPAVLLRGMAGSTLGIWVAHGEGRAHFPCPKVHAIVSAKNLAPMRYADDEGNATEIYPFNPNGSPDGVAALCSEDGRHLAMMPHPERSFRKWQAPWAPAGWVQHEAAPWLRLFQNATQFCGTAPRGCYTS